MKTLDETIDNFHKKVSRTSFHTSDREDNPNTLLKGDTYRICRIGESRYGFIPYGETTLNTVVVYDVENNIDRWDYSKKEILGLLKYLKDHQICIGFEAELWLEKNK